MPAKLYNRFPQIIAELPVRTDGALKAISEAVAVDARANAPYDESKPASDPHLRDSIHVERDGLGEYRVVAGDDKVFYGHMVELGTTHTPPRPFLVPAAERHRAEVEAVGAAALKGL